MKKLFCKKLVVLGVLVAFVFTFFSAFASPVSIYATTVNSTETRINDLVRRTARRQDVPGIAVSVVGYDSEAIFASHGVARRGSSVSVDENTFFSLGSVSKSFTAMGILYLDYSDEFDFTIGDPVQTHIPWLNFRYRSNFDMNELTVMNLVNHTSGLTNESHSLSLPPNDGEDAAYRIVRRFNNSRLDFRPGTRYVYGSCNYIVLGLVIQYVTSMPFEEFMHDRILGPLGLDKTFMFREYAAEAGVMASAHKSTWFSSRPFTPPTFRAHTPTGFIISNANDMARWMELNLNPASATSPFDVLLQKSQIPNTDVEAWNGYHYAAGWLIEYETGKIRHEGESPGFLAETIMFPDRGIGITVLLNSSSGDAANLVQNILLIIDGYERGAISSGSEFKMFDTLFGAISIVLMVFIFAIVILVVLKTISIIRGQSRITMPRKRSYLYLVLSTALFVFSIALIVVFPSIFNVGTWEIVNVWLPSTVLTGLILFCVTGFMLTVLATLSMIFKKKKTDS